MSLSTLIQPVIDGLKNTSIQDNLVVLATSIALSLFTSLFFATSWGTPRLHATIKLWSESLTKLHWAMFTYYTYLAVTYNRPRLVIMFIAVSLLLAGLSGYFTRKIVTEIEAYHKCRFNLVPCPLQQDVQCKTKEIVVDPLICVTKLNKWIAFKIIIENVIFALLGLGIALLTAFIFTKEIIPVAIPAAT